MKILACVVLIYRTILDFQSCARNAREPDKHARVTSAQRFCERQNLIKTDAMRYLLYSHSLFCFLPFSIYIDVCIYMYILSVSFYRSGVHPRAPFAPICTLSRTVRPDPNTI